MSSQRSENEYNRQILEAIASGQPVTQRWLANRLGVALGLTNLLIRRLVGQGYLQVSKMGTRRVKYLMTAEGWEALARATRLSLENTVRLYTQTRDQIRSGLAELSRHCEPGPNGEKCVVFYGAGDVAEIAYVSLQNTDLVLVGVIDDRRRGRFFDKIITPSDQLTADGLAGESYSHVVVTSLHHSDAIGQRLAALSIPPQRLFYL